MPGPRSLARQAPIAFVAGALLAACGGGSTSLGGPDPAPAKLAGPAEPGALAAHHRPWSLPQRPRSGRVSVSIDDYAYRPRTLSVTPGTRITFVNHDQQPHTATFQPASLGDKAIDFGARASVTLSQPGTYRYYCAFHAFMRATIVVTRRQANSASTAY